MASTGPEIVFVLVKPAVPGNIGAAARALKTMGFHELRLVDPCDPLSAASRMMAHASNEILERALQYSSLQAALEDVCLAVATTTKRRNVGQEKVYSRDLAAFIEKKMASLQRVAIVFGSEESGLTNEEVKRCHVVSKIPMAGKYPSLNLAQAVMIYSYELSRFSVKRPVYKAFHRPAEAGLRSLTAEAEDLLRFAGLKPHHHSWQKLFERMVLLGDEDIQLIHGLLRQMKESFHSFDTSTKLKAKAGNFPY